MSGAQFVLRVGAGLYIDSNGELRAGPDPSLPTYEPAGGGFDFNPTAIAEVFKGMSNALPQHPEDDDGKSRAKFYRNGVPEEIIDLLAQVAAIASVASVVFFVGVVLAIVRIFGLFRSGPSELERAEAHASSPTAQNVPKLLSDESWQPSPSRKRGGLSPEGLKLLRKWLAAIEDDKQVHVVSTPSLPSFRWSSQVPFSRTTVSV